MGDHTLYLDDLYVGRRFTSGTYRMEEADMVRFAAEFDPQPFHLDRRAAESSVFQGLAASGWYTASVAMRLLVTGGLPLAEGIVGLGGEIAWPKPTRPGDMVHLVRPEIEILLPAVARDFRRKRNPQSPPSFSVFLPWLDFINREPREGE